MKLIVLGFHVGLVDFFFFIFSTYLASLHFKPEEFWRWVFFFLFLLTAFLFFIAWLIDLGASL